MSNKPVFLDNDLERGTYHKCFTDANCTVESLSPEMRNAGVKDPSIIKQYGLKNIIVTHDRGFYKNKKSTDALKGVAVLRKTDSISNMKKYKDKVTKIFKKNYSDLSDKVTYIEEKKNIILDLK